MTQPQLYQSYAREQIVSFFGSPDEAQSFCNGQWLIFAKTAICLANVEKWPEKSFFDNGSHFYWVADQPQFAPPQVLGPKAKERALYLFASPPDSPEFLYLGELEEREDITLSEHLISCAASCSPPGRAPASC